MTSRNAESIHKSTWMRDRSPAARALTVTSFVSLDVPSLPGRVHPHSQDSWRRAAAVTGRAALTAILIAPVFPLALSAAPQRIGEQRETDADSHNQRAMTAITVPPSRSPASTVNFGLLSRPLTASRSADRLAADQPGVGRISVDRVRDRAGLARATAQLQTMLAQQNTLRADIAWVKARIAQLRSIADAIRAEIATTDYSLARPSMHDLLLDTAWSHGFADRLTTMDALVRDRTARLTLIEAQWRSALYRLDALRGREARLAADAVAARRVVNAGQALVARAQRVAAAASRSAARRSDTTAPSTGSPWKNSTASRVVAFAYAQLGKPYRFAAAGPGAFDCSGLTLASWRAVGVTLPHSAAQQFRAVPSVSRSALRPGDLVFYYSDLHHVALYVGGGKVIHAPEPGQSITIRPVDFAPLRGFGRPN